MYRTLSAPLSAQVEVTTRCQDECIHCYNFWRGKGVEEETLSRGQLLEVMGELVRLRVFKVIVTGGEPLLFADRVLEAISWAISCGLDCHLNTNLVTLNRSLAERILQTGVTSVLTSLPSYNERTHDRIVQHHGSFQRRVLGIRIALEAGLRVSVNMVVTTLNQGDVLKTGTFVAGLGVKNFNVTRATPPAGCTGFDYLQVSAETIRRHLAEMLRLKEKFGLHVDALEHYPLCLIGDLTRFDDFSKRKCSAGVASCAIGSKGEVRPCSHAPQVYGNILTEGLAPPWLRMTEWRDGSFLPDTCRSCEYLGRCSGGCRLEALYHGDIRGMDSHALGPEAITSPPLKQELELLPRETNLKLDPGVIFREEDFGGVVGRFGGKVSLITQGSYKLLRLLLNRPTFSIEGVAKECAIPLSKLSPFFSNLYGKGVLIKLDF